jgi:hypothetical protein
MLQKSSVLYSGQNFFAVKLNHALLICLPGMNVHDGGAIVEQFGYDLDVDRGIRADGPIAVDVLQGYLAVRASLNLLGIANVVVGLEGFRSEAPEFRCSLCIALVADYDILFHQYGHFAGVLASRLVLENALREQVR